MFYNYLKIAVRNILKQKAYSAINILGLALGLSACIFVGLFIWQEINYDNFHENGDNIYRISVSTNTPQGTYHSADTPALVSPTINQKYPEIQSITRVYFPDKVLINSGKNKLYEEQFIFADEGFFQIFTHEFIHGCSETALLEKNSVVLTRSAAKKYFGFVNPIGESLILNNKVTFQVTAIIEDVPVNSHFTFEMAATYCSLVDLPVGIYLDQWGATFGSYTYVLLHNETDHVEFGKKISPFLNDTMKVVEGVNKSFILQKLDSIHLYSNLEDEIKPNSSIKYLFILGSISLFILILACINYVNLSTARAVKRAKEIGVRKVFGANKQQLIRQFLGESVLITMLSLIIALVLMELFSTAFTRLIGTELHYSFFSNSAIFLSILLTAISIGLMSGLYPAFILTRYQPVQIVKGLMYNKSGSYSLLRKLLVWFQYTISIILIIFAFTINLQIKFMRTFDMGFVRDNVIVLKTPERMSNNSETIKSELNAIPGVIKTTASLGVPVLGNSFETNLTPDISKEDESFLISVGMIDQDYLDFYGIKLTAGKSLYDSGKLEYAGIAVINEATVKKLGYSSPEEVIGKSYTIGLSDGRNRFTPQIAGVVQDFHFKSLHEEISPLLFTYFPYLLKEISVKISPQDVSATISEIGKVWDKFYPEHPFNYEFLDEKVNELYEAEKRSFNIITTFSLIAIFISLIGLLGLTFYTTEQRRKEIGIRKILGASTSGIIRMITYDFIKIITISNLIALPVSYFIIENWLAIFPYRIKPDISVLFLAGIMTIFISILTISFTVTKSARENPADVLSYE